MKTHNRNQLTVVKHNALNQASYRLSLDEKRLILSAVAKVNPQEDMPSEITIHAREFARAWGTDESNSYRQLKAARKNLFDRAIKITRPDGEIEHARWVYNTKYKDGEGYIKLSFSPTVIPYLSNLKSHFTSYKLVELKRLKSSHAIRLYELLMQYKETGWFSENLEALKDVFGVSGKYPRWVDFKKYVIENAIREINAATNWTVKYEAKKRGRKIDRLTFFFKPSSQRVLEF